MNAQEKTKLKEWWDNCPSKEVMKLKGILATVFSLFFIYELAYGLGKFLAYITI